MNLDHVFQYHSPNEEQIKSYSVIREAARGFAECILNECPSSADRSDALRKVREAVMTANASIALDGEI